MQAVQTRLDEFLETRTPILAPLGEHPLTLLDVSRSFLSGGKRFRAQFCYWGWRSVTVADSVPEQAWSGILTAAAALEVFHAAALVHDDLIDHSDLRRGAPSAHRRFERIHDDNSWAADGIDFGRASAVLLGDLLIVWSDELLDDSLDSLPGSTAAAVRSEFNRMRTQVTAGQYLDIVAERAWRTLDSDPFEQARRVIVYKSAKYSVESPLALGALHGRASDQQLAALRAYGLPLGVAYQLRDDLLGVFGDPARTGKPSGDDLREGKRTVLVALARRNMGDSDREELDRALGDPELSGDRVRHVQHSIRDSGAAAEVEELIALEAARALDALEDAPLEPQATQRLRELASTVTVRDA